MLKWWLASLRAGFKKGIYGFRSWVNIVFPSAPHFTQSGFVPLPPFRFVLHLSVLGLHSCYLLSQAHRVGGVFCCVSLVVGFCWLGAS